MLQTPGQRLRRRVWPRVLDATTVDDAREVYAAIRLANPGGLGRASEQDVAREPTQTLRDVMRLAADRDGVAREYDTGFATTFDDRRAGAAAGAAPTVSGGTTRSSKRFSRCSRRRPTRTSRGAPGSSARTCRALAVSVLARGGVRTDAGRAAVNELNESLRDPGNMANPGTSADLVTASIFALLVSTQIA